MNAEDLRQKRGNRKAQFPQMEERLKQYCLKNPTASRNSVVKKAKVLIHQFNYDSEAINSFSFSKGWFQRFRERHGLRSKKKQEKSQSQEYNGNPDNIKDTEEPIIDNIKFQVKMQPHQDAAFYEESNQKANDKHFLVKQQEKQQYSGNICEQMLIKKQQD